MNILIDLVDAAIKQGGPNQCSSLLQAVTEAPGDSIQSVLGPVPSNVFYVLKRLINASMSTQSEIKDNSTAALKTIVDGLEVQLDSAKLIAFIIEASGYKRSGNRKSEAEAFAAGRVAVYKTLNSWLKNNSNVFEDLLKVLKDYPLLEPQVIEACHAISWDKHLKLKFLTLKPTTLEGRFLYKLFLGIRDESSQKITAEQIEEIIQENMKAENFPRKSLALQFLGKYMELVLESPAVFFEQYADKFLESQKEVDIHEIYYVLVIFRAFLATVTINKQNKNKYFSKRMVAVWLEQLRVLNKRMKKIAKSITISIEPDAELAFDILVSLHESGIYMENISIKHPLNALYQAAQAHRYWKYVFDLCQAQAGSLTKIPETEEQQDLQSEQAYYNQLQFFTRLRSSELATQQISKTIVFLINLHKEQDQSKNQTNQSKQILFLIINLLDLFCGIGKSKKKRDVFNKKALIVFSHLEIGELKIEQDKQNQIRSCIKWLKKKTLKLRKGEQELALPQIHFFNFYVSMLAFALIYPEQLATCLELQPLYDDLTGFFQTQEKPRKKVKKQKEEASQPIHVLIDIFISMMTKPPQFLRRAVHCLYEDLLPFLNEVDLESMLTVITTPDAEFIEQI